MSNLHFRERNMYFILKGHCDNQPSLVIGTHSSTVMLQDASSNLIMHNFCVELTVRGVYV